VQVIKFCVAFIFYSWYRGCGKLEPNIGVHEDALSAGPVSKRRPARTTEE
jgi:hypothetical protein